MLPIKLGTLLVIAICCVSGCSQARYSAATLPSQYVAPHHISARHVDFTSMRRNSIPNEWLQAGDEVTVSIATGVEKGEVPEWELAIAPDGSLNIPLVGAAMVAGLNPNAAAARIRDEAIRRGIYVDPKVTVLLQKKRSFKIAVVGAVNRPDTYEIPATSCDLLTALTMAEGVSDEASRFIQIRHSQAALQNMAMEPPAVGPNGVVLASFNPQSPPPTIVNLDLANIQAISEEALRLYDGSVVQVTREPKRYVSVMGLVRDAKRVEMPDGEDFHLLDAIAQAGGTTLSIADKVFIIRNVDGQADPIVIEASLKEAREGRDSNMLLAAGDVVSVEETTATVTLQAIQTFFRVGFSAALPGF